MMLPEVMQEIAVGFVVLAAAVGALVGLLPVTRRTALARRFEGWLPAVLRRRLAPPAGCGACGGAGSPPRP